MLAFHIRTAALFLAVTLLTTSQLTGAKAADSELVMPELSFQVPPTPVDRLPVVPVAEPSAEPMNEPYQPSGVRGQVLRGPVCPSVSFPPKRNCAPQPYQTELELWNADRSAMLDYVTSNRRGRFYLVIEPGSYWLQPKTQPGLMPMGAGPMWLEIKPGKFTRVTYLIDSGVR